MNEPYSPTRLVDAENPVELKGNTLGLWQIVFLRSEERRVGKECRP